MENATIAELVYERQLKRNALSRAARSDVERLILHRYEPTIESDAEEIAREHAAFGADVDLRRFDLPTAPLRRADEICSRPSDDKARAGKRPKEKDPKELGIRSSRAQSDRAKKPRIRFANGISTQELISKLALSAEYRDLIAKELWTHFWAVLDEIYDELEEVPLQTNHMFATYRYKLRERWRTISYKYFANLVSKARQKKSH
jgi:hypothetical protein